MHHCKQSYVWNDQILCCRSDICPLVPQESTRVQLPSFHGTPARNISCFVVKKRLATLLVLKRTGVRLVSWILRTHITNVQKNCKGAVGIVYALRVTKIGCCLLRTKFSIIWSIVRSLQKKDKNCIRSGQPDFIMIK